MRRRTIIKVLLVFICVLVVGAGAIGAYAYKTLREIQKNPIAAFNNAKDEKPEDMTIEVKDASGQTTEQTLHYNPDIVSLVVLGLDSDAVRKTRNMGYRSDTIIVAAINMKTKEATMITVPRDTRTMVKKVNSKGKTTSQSLDKINAAFAYGRGRDNYSYPNALDAISNLLGGIPLKQYAGIDMDGIAPVTNAVGGVPLKIDVSIPKYGLVKGTTVLLTGDKAEGYVRERHIPGTGGSDIERTKRQQRFMKAFLAKVKKLGPVDAVPKLYSKTRKYVDTNLTMDQMAAFALVLKDMDLEKIKIVSVPGHAQTINKLSYWVVDQNALKQMITDIYYTKE